MPATDATRRFSSRVEDYRRYRPGYPRPIVKDLAAAGVLRPGAVVADVGSGTGLLARLFLEAGCAVTGIEPNAQMRAAGEEELREFPSFSSMAGTAEATGLAEGSVDLVTAGQAFHWFDPALARQEFGRVLRPGGTCVLVWNDRRTEGTAFLVAYEELLRAFATDYAAVDHKQMTEEVLAAFFAPAAMTCPCYPNEQVFDFAALKGRLLSSSYAPAAGHPGHEPMLARLRQIFDNCQREGQVSFVYDTKVYCGQLV